MAKSLQLQIESNPDIYSFLCTIYEEPDHKEAVKLSGESSVSVDDDA